MNLNWTRALVIVLAPPITTDVLIAGDVRVVAAGTSFTSIQPAVNASVDGDIVIVKTGTYAGFALNAKGVCVTADLAASVTLTSSVAVQNLSATQRAMITGFQTTAGAVLVATNVAGSLRVNGCTFNAGSSNSAAGNLTNCADVGIAHSTFIGGSTLSMFPTGPGLNVAGGKVALDHCTVRGGTGIPGGHAFDVGYAGGPGQAGLAVADAQVFVGGSTIEGGQGGYGASGTCTPGLNYPTSGGPGGVGLFANANSIVRLLDTSVTGGAGGWGGTGFPGSCQQPDGAPGTAFNAPPGVVTMLPGSSRELAEIRPVREGGLLSLTFTGQPGDRAFLASSTSTAHEFTPALSGVRLFAPSARRLFLGTIGPSGTLTASLPIPVMASAALGTTFFLQAVTVDTANQSWLATPVTLVIIDASL